MLLGALIVLGGQGWQPHRGPPPAELSKALAPPTARVEFGGTTTGTASYSMSARLVTVTWYDAGSRARRYQRFELPYWPTAIVSLGRSGEVAVGGKRADGRTVIERIRFRQPVLVAEPPAQGGTGTPVFRLDPATIEARDFVYDEATQGRDMVSELLPWLPDPDRVLARFHDSRDLVVVDLRDGGTSRVASPHPVAGALLVPPLDAPFPVAWARDHRDVGHVYVFSDQHSGSTLVVVDANRDGVLDTYQDVPHAEWTEFWGSEDRYR